MDPFLARARGPLMLRLFDLTVRLRDEAGQLGLNRFN
jgi:hypothetical protein